MSCLPTYKGIRYKSTNDLFKSIKLSDLSDEQKIILGINKYDWNKEQIDEKQDVEGIEINSYQTGLGNDLTNVHYAKNGKSKFDIIPSNKELILTKEAKAKWGESVETWYKSNNAQTKGIPEGVEGDKYDFDLMVGLITDKLNQYPDLVKQINERGGLEFLQKSTHTIGTGRWSSSNPKNMFMNVLKQAYKNVSNSQSTVINPKIDSTNSDINKILLENSNPEITGETETKLCD